VSIYRAGWKECKIIDVISLEYGKGLNDYREGIGKYDVFGTNGRIGVTEQFLYDQQSIIIGRKGAYREVHLAKKPFFVIDTAFYTKKKTDDIDTLFLYYWFKGIDINQMDSGSAIPSTSREEVYDLDILRPPLPEQKAIAAVLSSLDDKIDLLHRQNKTLEALAETLFRQWFVEDVQEDWEEKIITDFFEIRDGTHDSPKQNPTGKPLLTSKHIFTNRLDIENAYLISEEDFINVNKRSNVDTNDILISMIGTIGLIYLDLKQA
jgi:type I restriction enzyme S subunit